MPKLLANFLHATVSIAAETAPYIVLGTAIAGLIRAFLRPEGFLRHLRKPGWRSVTMAGAVGVPLPLCSCSVLPVAAELRRKGASKGATSAFLISTPESGVDSIILSFALLNPVLAIARPFGAFVTAFTAGVLQDTLVQDASAPPAPKAASCGSHCGCSHSHLPTPQAAPGLLAKLAAGQRQAFAQLLPDLATLFLLGIASAGLLVSLVPESALEAWVGGGLPGMLAVAVLSAGLYLCASTATPLAAALIAKGMSPGTALVMLLAGPATSIASVLQVRRLLGGRGLAIYLGSVVGCAIVLGLALDFLVLALALPMGVSLAITAATEPPGLWTVAVGGGFLAYCLGCALIQRLARRPGHSHNAPTTPAQNTVPAG